MEAATAPPSPTCHQERKAFDSDRLEGSFPQANRPAQLTHDINTPSNHQGNIICSHDYDTQRKRDIPAYNFSFAMGGWLMIYNFGVAKCLLDHGLHTVHPEQSIIGSSAGSLAATALVLEADIDKIVTQAKTSFVPRTHATKAFGLVYGMFYIGTYLQESMLECLPFEKVKGKLYPGRLIIVMASLLGWNSIRARDIKDGEELVDALRCSCAAFPLVMPHRFRGKRCFDGFFAEGITSPLLTEEEAGGLETITISPLYASRATIRPSRYVPLSWAALPPNDPCAIDWLYDLGYRDALFWMAKQGIGHTCVHETRFSEDATRVRASTNNEYDGQHVEVTYDNDESDDDSRLHGEDKNGRSEPVRLDSRHQVLHGVSCIESRCNKELGWDTSSNEHNIMDKAEDHSGRADNGKTLTLDGKGPKPISRGYVRSSFVLAECDMRPRRDRHPQLDASEFVPSLKQFVGHGTYHAALDLAFVIFFSGFWRPAAAFLIYLDLTLRLIFALFRGATKELKPFLRWIFPALVLVIVMQDSGPSSYECTGAMALLAAFVMVRGSRENSPSAADWRAAHLHASGLLEYRILLRCFPWGNRQALRSEALETSLLYRAASFFM